MIGFPQKGLMFLRGTRLLPPLPMMMATYANGPLADQWYWIDRDNRDLAMEFDASLIYDYTEDVQMGLVSAWFLPGSFFVSTNDENAYQVRAYASVDF